MEADNASTLSGSAIAEVAELARRGTEPSVIEIGEYSFAHKDLVRIDTDPLGPSPVDFQTLGGLVGYLAREEAAKDCVVHVLNPCEVHAFGLLSGRDKNKRILYARAEFEKAPDVQSNFGFNNFFPMENINIALQTMFQPGKGDVDNLRQFCASVRSTKEAGLDDDGMSQTVTAKASTTIAALATVRVQNPWRLAPWSTFPDVDQPLRPFVLRFKPGAEIPQAGLFGTGDATWHIEAVRNIVAHLKEKVLPTQTVVG